MKLIHTLNIHNTQKHNLNRRHMHKYAFKKECNAANLLPYITFFLSLTQRFTFQPFHGTFILSLPGQSHPWFYKPFIHPFSNLPFFTLFFKNHANPLKQQGSPL